MKPVLHLHKRVSYTRAWALRDTSVLTPISKLPSTCCFVAKEVFPGKFLLQPMDLGSCRGFTGSNSIPRHKSYSHGLPGAEMKWANKRYIYFPRLFNMVLISMNPVFLNAGSHPVFSPKCCSSWTLLNWVRSPMFSTPRVSVMDDPSFPPRLRL